ncbi:MAG: prolipoprotein diacylglyceryl transferase [Candidatus Pacearchaeota archaeon]
MYTWNLNPIALDLGFFQIRWYSLMYVLGFIIAYYMISWLAKEKHIEVSKDDVADMLLYLAIGMILGARLFYVIFYNFSYYFTNLLEIPAVWHGGLSFHGGFLGATLGVYYWCKRKKQDFWKLADLAVIPGAIALAFGRIGNFMNGELWGRTTDVAWCVNFPDVKGCRHPSQLYESLKNVIIFAVLFSVRKSRQMKEGMLFSLFMTLYGLFRFVIEFFREPDEQLGFIFANLSMGQLLSMVMFIIGAALFLKLKNKTK